LGPLLTKQIVQRALGLWGMDGARFSLAAARENAVYKVESDQGEFALRLHRAGYRSQEELRSELDWMAALETEGLEVPRPVAAKDGSLCLFVDGVVVDMLSWLAGEPMGRDGEMILAKPESAYHALGQEMARLHEFSDRWRWPSGFTRPAWNIEGLVGEEPLWGRFWENPTLTGEQVDLFGKARELAAHRLDAGRGKLDYGLIHADLVPENVLIDGSRIKLIDFDDGGFGFRLFDIATTLKRARRTKFYEVCRESFLSGYRSKRRIDLDLLPLFQALRALTYVGWILPRMDEPGAASRNQRFVQEAEIWVQEFLSSG